MFTGRLKITVCAAKDLQLTNFMTRHGLAAMGGGADAGAGGGGGAGGAGGAGGGGGGGGAGEDVGGGHISAGDGGGGVGAGGGRKESVLPGLDPYVQIDVDEVSIERSSTKGKTRNPTWNETFTTELLRNANEAGFTVWHDATMPPDDFVANCKVQLADLIDEKEEQRIHDLWVSELGLRKEEERKKEDILSRGLNSFYSQPPFPPLHLILLREISVARPPPCPIPLVRRLFAAVGFPHFDSAPTEFSAFPPSFLPSSLSSLRARSL